MEPHDYRKKVLLSSIERYESEAKTSDINSETSDKVDREERETAHIAHMLRVVYTITGLPMFTHNGFASMTGGIIRHNRLPVMEGREAATYALEFGQVLLRL